jgi:hypothetical protein
MDSLKMDIHVWPILAIFFFVATMLIPEMITNIDDSFDSPKLFNKARLGLTLGSNVIRDSLFALFFFLSKKNEL